MWYTHTMEYHSALKRNNILTHATIWVNLENPDTKEQILYEVSRIGTVIKTESRKEVPREEGNVELFFSGYRTSVWNAKNVFKMDRGDGCTTLQIVHLKMVKTVNLILCILHNLKSSQRDGTSHSLGWL